MRDDDGSGYVNRYLDFSRAVHVVLGYDLKIWKDITLHTETYYQYLYGIPVRKEKDNSYSSINDNDAFSKRALENEGIGTNYGLELTVEKAFSKNYYFLVTGSLYNSRYQGSDGVWRNTKYNGNYITSLTAGKDFRVGKNGKHVIGINIKLFYAGGRRITPIDLESSIAQGKQVKMDEKRYEGRISDYFRLDTRVRFKQNFRKFAWEVSIDIQNTTNKKNEIKRKYDSETESIKKKYQQGIIPVLRLRFEF